MSATRLDRNGSVDFAEVVPRPVPLGGSVYDVVPQKLGRIRSRLGVELQGLESIGDVEGGLQGFVGESLERAHRLLSVFVPDLMPVWTFCGFGDEASWAADDYDEARDAGPTLPQIVYAFETVLEVNRLDLLGHLKNVLSPELIRALIQERALDLVRAQVAEESATPSSPTSSSTPGPDAPSTSSGMTLPIEQASPSG